MKKIDDINRVLVVGAGTLGLRIALRCAFDGYQVKMFDVDQQQLANAVEMQTRLAQQFVKRRLVDQQQLINAKQNLTVTNDLNEAVKGIDLVSESVTENIDIKNEFYADLMPRLESGVIVTTNTSYLRPSDLLEAVPEPELFCALHFHDVFNQTVVDIMPHPGTAPEVSDLLMEFGRRINQIPVFVQKENPGYIFNSMLMVILGQAASLLLNGVGSIQDIDRSFMGNFKTAAGPFGMLDQVGLDTALHITSVRSDPKSVGFSKLLREKVDAGQLGYKTGAGFYTYPNPEYAEPDFLK